MPSCVPYGLLSEVNIRETILSEIKFASWDTSQCFFYTGTNEMPYDLFSATFFLTSRYEEWLDHTPDIHQRYSAESSILFKNNVLDEPLVNQWALQFMKVLSAYFPELAFKPRQFSYISTIDIDITWKYRNKGFLRSLLGFAKDVLKRQWGDVKERVEIIARRKPDPFFNFDWQIDFHQLKNIKTQYFIQLGNYGSFDKNTNHKNKELMALIKKLDAAPNTNVGIHPSYASNSKNGRVQEEIRRLNDILGKETSVSRQHFLMHKMPYTYRNLLQLGITEDHTMGYSTHLGFRAGIAAPFYWYDLHNNQSTALLLVPFCSMDITPLHYYGENMDEAIVTLRNLMKKVKAIGGLYVSLWHNDSLGERDRWRGWRKVYEAMIASVND